MFDRVIAIGLPARAGSQPRIARLIASVAPLVKTTVPARRKQRGDLLARHLDRRFGLRARGGAGCADWRSPSLSGPPSHGSIASRASGASGVVA